MLNAPEEGIEFLCKNWRTLRRKARKIYEEHGRGAFLLELPCAANGGLRKVLRYMPKAKIPKTSAFVYLGTSVGTYNPEREIVCLVYHGESGTAKTEVLSEDKYGNPPTAKGSDDVRKRAKRSRKVAPPIVTSSLDSARAKNFAGLLDALDDRISRMRVEGLNPRERLVWEVMTLSWEVENGGLEQYFTNAGERSAHVLSGLREIGATEVLVIFSKACSAFPRGVPSSDPATADRQLDSISRRKLVAWGKLDDKLFAALKNLPELLWTYWVRTPNKKKPCT